MIIWIHIYTWNASSAFNGGFLIVRGEKIRMAGLLTNVVVADNRADRTSCGK